MSYDPPLRTLSDRRRIDRSILRRIRAGVWTCDEGNPLDQPVLQAIDIHGYVVEVREDEDSGVNLRYETPLGVRVAGSAARRYTLPDDEACAAEE